MAKSKKPVDNAEMNDIVTEIVGDVVADASPQADAQKTPKIVVDGVEYEAANLSVAAKGAIASLQFAEAKIMALQNELAVCQTARFAYAKGLKADLEGKTSDA